MANLAQLRTTARKIFDAALRGADAGDAVTRAITLDGSRLKIRDLEFNSNARSIYYVAIGKAAISMATALEALLGNRITEGLIAGGDSKISSRLHTRSLLRRRWYQGGHPLPNKRSLLAGAYALELLGRADHERALVIFLVSGGGSAMLEWPVSDDISLASLRTANKILVSCGASISEINSVRRAFSAVKGGKLAARAPNCEQVTLIVSDVPDGQERSVASGPTVAVPEDGIDPRDVIDRYRLKERLPPTIVRAIEAAAASPIQSVHISEPLVLLDNGSALRAAVRAIEELGFVGEITDDVTDQPIEEGCELLLDRLSALRASHRGSNKTVCLVSGGEFSCPVRGDGIGGRNLETALRLALAADKRRKRFGDFVALCAGTDGIDGNSPAAGAIIDSTTIRRAKAIGLDPEDFLRRSDSYSFFHALGDDITTGPTGTNVRDVRLLLVES